MKNFRFIIAVWVCKLLILVSKMLGKKGTTTPAVPAMKICPNIIDIISSRVKQDIIVVCGTNGKTTTNNIICSALENKGYKVACNKVGANMIYGVAVSFIEKVNVFGKCNIDYACIEVDEASASKVFKHFLPNYIVITNLFRDQLDRYGEIDLTLNYLKTAIDMSKDVKLVINGDDPLCQLLAVQYKKTYVSYGIGEKVSFPIQMNEIKDSQFCGICGERLKYNHYFYGQLGDYYCPKCGFKREKINYKATNLNLGESNIQFTFNESQELSVNNDGFYNIYNLLAAIAMLKEIGINASDVKSIIENHELPIGRMEKFNLKKEVILNLSKNPTGFTQSIMTMLSDNRTKDVIIMINDGAQDGTDISWLWDVDFEKIQNENVISLSLAGRRREDLAVRFKYAKVNKKNQVYENLEKAVLEALDRNGEVVYLLVNYTAIFAARDILKRLEKNFKEGNQ